MPSQSSFQFNVYRLSVNNNSYLDELLGYDFLNHQDEQEDTYWRNIINLSDEDYYDFYDKKLSDILKQINVADFSLSKIDITEGYQDFVSSIDLHEISKAITITFKDGLLKLRENDLIEVMEDGYVIFLGFVTNISNSLNVDSFFTQTIIVNNVAKMFTLPRIANNGVVADYAVKGLDLKLPDISVFSDIYNNKNTFEIIETIMTNIYGGMPQPSSTADFDTEYIFDETKIFNLTTFNILYAMLMTLYLYNTQFGKQYTFCKISHGNHKTYNSMIAKSFNMFLPTYKSPEEVLKNITKDAMYDVFCDYQGSIIVRPPLYNYLPFDCFDWTTGQFNPNSDFVIKRRDIHNYTFAYDNTAIQTRTDSYWTYPLIGTYTNWKPQFYEDIKGLVKFGFRNSEPYNNPNAISPKGARILSVIQNNLVNHSSRNLVIEYKKDLSLNTFNFELGRLYYIDLPDEKLSAESATQINTLQNSISNLGVVGYLSNVTKAIKTDTYIMYKLTFTFLRQVEFLNSADMTTDRFNNILPDLFEIYNSKNEEGYNEPSFYRLLGKLQGKEINEISPEVYTTEYTTATEQFAEQFKLPGDNTTQQYVPIIPIFKVMPTIMNLIELTYKDAETKSFINSVVNNTVPTETTNVDMVGDFLRYISYKFKLQRFFNGKFKDNMLTLSGNRTGQFTYNEPQKMPNAQDTTEQKQQELKIYNNFVSEYRKNNSGSTYIHNYEQTNRFLSFVLNMSTAAKTRTPLMDNVETWGCTTPFNINTQGEIFLGNISQKLFNRICEMDVAMQEEFNMPMSESLLKFETGTGLFAQKNIDWRDLQPNTEYTSSLSVTEQDYMSVFLNPWNGLNKLNDIFTIPTNISGKDLPKGVALLSDVSGSYSNVKQYNGSHLLSTETGLDGRDTYISPGFYFNMSTILNYNTIMTNPSEVDLAKFKKDGGRESGAMLAAHKNGLALDFILPARPKNISMWGINSDTMPWVYYSMGGEYSIKEKILEKFTNMLYNYFDRVTISTTTVSVDMGLLATGTANNDIKTYAVDVYHIGVDDAVIGKYTTEVSRPLRGY